MVNKNVSRHLGMNLAKFRCLFFLYMLLYLKLLGILDSNGTLGTGTAQWSDKADVHITNRITLRRIRIQLSNLIRIRILTLMRIRNRIFIKMRIRIRIQLLNTHERDTNLCKQWPKGPLRLQGLHCEPLRFQS